MELSTSVYPTFVETLFKEMGSDSATLIHAGVGIVGEVGEYSIACGRNDRTNALEELGDVAFYTQKIMNRFGWAWEEYYAQEESPSHASIFTAACDVLDLLKKYWVYERPLEQDVFYRVFVVYLNYFKRAMHSWGFTLEEVKLANMKKLAKRYPNGYTDAAARARADKPAGE